MYSRIGFPFDVVEGKLHFHTGVTAATEALRLLLSVSKGELPLSRDYGSDLDYNIPLNMAYTHHQQLVETIGTYHPQIKVTDMAPVVGSDGTVVDWQVSAEVEDEI